MSIYQEGKDSTFTHNGKTWPLDPFLARAAKLPVKKVPADRLRWNLDLAGPADSATVERIRKADTSIPILYTIDPKWGYVVVDGWHRLNKVLLVEHKNAVLGKEIPQSWFKEISPVSAYCVNIQKHVFDSLGSFTSHNPAVAGLYLVGSTANLTCTDRSDLDFLVTFKDVNPKDYGLQGNSVFLYPGLEATVAMEIARAVGKNPVTRKPFEIQVAGSHEFRFFEDVEQILKDAIPLTKRTISMEDESSPSYTVGKVTREQAFEWLAEHSQSRPEPFNAGAFNPSGANEDRVYAFAYKGDEVVGYACLLAGQRYLIDMFVPESLRGQGIGRQLVDSLLVDLVVVRKHQEDIIAFLKATGFSLQDDFVNTKVYRKYHGPKVCNY